MLIVDDDAPLRNRLARAMTQRGFVVAAAASTQARMVAALQGVAPAVPVVLTPEALSPAFAAGLDEASGTTAGAYLSAGTDAGDATSLAQGARAEARERTAARPAP